MDEQSQETTMDSSLQLLGAVDDEISNKTRSDSSFPTQLLEVEEIIGYKFKNRKLLQQAFTHPSYHDPPDSESYEPLLDSESYERLEYVGDSVLNLLVARGDFFTYPKISPGTLTRLRSANVDSEKLARAALKLNLHKYLFHKKPLLDGQIEVFMKEIVTYPIHSHGLIHAPKVLADVVESTIGAIFIDTDSSIETTWKVVRKILEPIITLEMLGVHPKTRFYQMCQKNGLKACFVDLWKETGIIEVLVNGELVGRAIYISKKDIAYNRAADDAYNKLVKKFLSKQNLKEKEKEDTTMKIGPFETRQIGIEIEGVNSNSNSSVCISNKT